MIHNCFGVILEHLHAFATYLYVTDSPMGIAAVGSFFGAVGGYVMVMITNRRAEVISKIRHTKTAIGITHDLFNIFLSLKKQHVKSMCELYESKKKEFVDAKSGKLSGIQEITIPFDNKTISFPFVDFELLNSKLLEKPELPLRALVIATTLIRVIHELKNQVNFRHGVLAEVNQLAMKYDLNDHGLACLYYGIRLDRAGGSIQYDTYCNVMKAINDFCDDAIWFSKELTAELIKVGKETAGKIYFGRPKIGLVDYSDIDPSLLPKDENYKDWREKFKQASS